MKKYLLIIIILFIGCREEITIDLPNPTEQMVVQGSIEPGFPPYIILTKNQGYFDPIDNNTYDDLFIKDSTIVVWKKNNDGSIDSVQLHQLPPPLDSIPIYTDLEYLNNPFSEYEFSEEGNSYHLSIKWNQMEITSTTTIPYSTPLDSIWIAPTDNTNDKPFRFEIRATYSDPDTMGNNIFIRSKRIEHWIRDTLANYYPENNLIPDIDESLILVDCGSDILINGSTFETFFPRPIKGSFPTGDYNTSHYKRYQDSTTSGKDSVFTPHDILILKFCQVDESSMRFWRGIVRNITSGGNPFAEPMNLPSNINGGLGIWTGYGTRYYKIPIVKDTTIFEDYIPDIVDIF